MENGRLSYGKMGELKTSVHYICLKGRLSLKYFFLLCTLHVHMQHVHMYMYIQYANYILHISLSRVWRIVMLVS